MNILHFPPVRICLPQLAVVLILLFLACKAFSTPKTDLVIFNNGDRLTGELKSLKRGRLNLNTEATGTIGIE